MKRHFKYYLVLVVFKLIILYFISNFLYGNPDEELIQFFNNTKTSKVLSNKENVGNPRIFCLVLTCPKNLLTKSEIVFNTWVNKCDDHLFVSVIPSVVLNEKDKIKNKIGEPFEKERTNGMKFLQPGGYYEEDYHTLTTKVFLAIKYVFEKKKQKHFDWFIKADDDSYILMNNLRHFLMDKNSSSLITYGSNLKLLVEKGYHSGGGYVLSNRAFSKLGNQLSRNYTFCVNSGIEDVDVARCLRRLDVYPGVSMDSKKRERFHLLSFYNHYNGNFPSWIYDVKFIF
jgi:glycoprotein-N-acetylgalactosamine 3-beta-galactosyltransferase